MLPLYYFSENITADESSPRENYNNHSTVVKGEYILAVVYKISEFYVISDLTFSPTTKDIMTKIYYSIDYRVKAF